MQPNLHPLRLIRCCVLIGTLMMSNSFTNLIAQQSTPLLNLVKDINTTGEPLTFNDYYEWADVNGDLFFVLKRKQLWMVKQADPMAFMLKEFVAATTLTNVNGTLYFAADDGIHGNEVWTTDGTAERTVLVKDINPGPSGSDPVSFTYANGLVFFSAHDGSRGRELWKSNGTVQGTMIVKDIMRVVGSSNPASLLSMNNLLYFTANDGQHGYEIWTTDGTTSGTQMFKDIRPNYRASSHPRELVNVDGKIFFVAYDNYILRRLWVSDGTADGTIMVSTAGKDSANSEPVPVDYMTEPLRLTNVNGTLFFVGKDAEHGFELWKSDGTAKGTVMVKDIRPGFRSPLYLHHLTSYNDRLYFVASSTYDLWTSDGTESGTVQMTYSNQIQLTGYPDLTGFNDSLYFLGMKTYEANSMHIYRGTTTPESVGSFIQNPNGQYALTHLTVSGEFLYYVSDGNLWRTDGTIHQPIQQILYKTLGSEPANIVVANGNMYFSAFDGLTFGLWKSDGTPEGTYLIHRFEENVQYLTESGNYLYYWGNGIDTDSISLDLKLWRTDLTNDETTWVSDINKGRSDYLAELEDVNGTLFFSIEVPMVEGEEFPRQAQLWKTSGTLQSTEFIKTFNEAGLPPIFLTNVNGTLFFSAVTDPNVGEELWKSDGTAAGTVMVEKINPNPLEPSAPSLLVNMNNILYFSAYTGQYQLWRSDGTEEGTYLVKDINPSGITNLDDTLYFHSGSELWKSDGSVNGTMKVATFTAPDGARVYKIYVLGKIDGNLIVATSYASSTFLPGALWKTNGTPEGTEVILSPVDNLTAFSNIIAKDNIIYFTGPVNNTPVYHLWRTNGTTCGTFPVLSSGTPDNLTLFNDHIYMPWTDQRWGRELFGIDEGAIIPPCVDEMIATNEGSEARNATVVSNYPNPFTEDFVVNISGGRTENYKVQIKDFTGKVVESRSNLVPDTEYRLGSELRPGLYILKVIEGTQVKTVRIIKRP